MICNGQLHIERGKSFRWYRSRKETVLGYTDEGSNMGLIFYCCLYGERGEAHRKREGFEGDRGEADTRSHGFWYRLY